MSPPLLSLYTHTLFFPPLNHLRISYRLQDPLHTSISVSRNLTLTRYYYSLQSLHSHLINTEASQIAEIHCLLRTWPYLSSIFPKVRYNILPNSQHFKKNKHCYDTFLWIHLNELLRKSFCLFFFPHKAVHKNVKAWTQSTNSYNSPN